MSIEIGSNVTWTTFGGDKYSGEVFDIDGNVAHIKCDDGETRAVEIDFNKPKYVPEDERSSLFKIGDKVKPISKTTIGHSFEIIIQKMKDKNVDQLQVTRIRDEKEDYNEDGQLVIWADFYDSGCGYPFYESDLINLSR